MNLRLFDPDALFQRMENNAELVCMVLQAYCEDMRHRSHSLAQYLEAGLPEQAMFEAHSIKGASALVGAEALSVLAAELEMACHEGYREQAIYLFGQIQQILPIVTERVQQTLREMQN